MSENLSPFSTIPILRLITDAQQMHGLRYENYQRYRGYCNRKVKRIRRSLNFNNVNKPVGKSKKNTFIGKPITADVVESERHLEILIFDAERNWAYAMQLKYETETDPFSRKKFHLRLKLRKAAKYSEQLASIIKQSPRTDALTKLEAQAYNAFIKATLFLEIQQWSNALEMYRIANLIYEKLSMVVSGPLAKLYIDRRQKIQNTLKLCEYNAKEAGETLTSDLERLKLEENEWLTNDIDMMLTEIQIKEIEKALQIGESTKRDNPKSFMPLIENLEKWHDFDVDELRSKEPGVILVQDLQPLQPVPSKPMFFDLAQYHIKMPDMNEELTKFSGEASTHEQGGLASYMKNLLWGK